MLLFLLYGSGGVTLPLPRTCGLHYVWLHVLLCTRVCLVLIVLVVVVVVVVVMALTLVPVVLLMLLSLLLLTLLFLLQPSLLLLLLLQRRLERALPLHHLCRLVVIVQLSLRSVALHPH